MAKHFVVTCRRYFDLSKKKNLSISADVSVSLCLSVTLSLELSVHKNGPVCAKWVCVQLHTCVCVSECVQSWPVVVCALPDLEKRAPCCQSETNANANAKRIAL